METERLSGADRILVPNRFRVHLNPDDLASFGDMSVTLAAELADGALAFARAHRYAVADMPRVDLASDSSVGRGEVGSMPASPTRGRDLPTQARDDPTACRHGGGRRRGRRDGRSRGARFRLAHDGLRGTQSVTPKARMPRAAARRHATGGRARQRVADDRAGERQRACDPRRPCLPPPRAAAGSARHARLHRPAEHQRLAGQRRARRGGRARRGRPNRAGRHGPRRRNSLVELTATPWTRSRSACGCCVSLFLALPVPVSVRRRAGARARPARRRPRARGGAGPALRRRVAGGEPRAGDRRSRSTRSRPSGGTSTTRSSSTTGSRPLSTRC